MSYFTGILGLTAAQVTALIARNEADGTAGLYACKTILNEHRPVCTKEYHLQGKYLDGVDNSDVWYPIAGAGGGTVVYDDRFLTLTSGIGAASASRCVIDTTKFPIAGNFEEVTCRIGTITAGAGGSRYTSIGFVPAFSGFNTTVRAVFCCANGAWYVGYTGTGAYKALTALPIGRNLQSGDIVTIRLDRQEGSANIDIARFYINGQKQYETTAIPTEDCYAGVGVFADVNTTTATALSIDYFGCKYVP